MSFIEGRQPLQYCVNSPRAGLTTWDWEDVCSDHAEAVSGIDLGVSGSDSYGISIDKGMLKILVEETVRDVLGEKATKPVVIQKYKMKHK